MEEYPIIPRTRLDELCELVESQPTPVLFCERYDGKSEIWNWNRHKHNCVELIYFLSGSANLTVGDKYARVDAMPYDLVIYPPNMYHSEQLQGDEYREIICLWIDIPGLSFSETVRIQDGDASIKTLLINLYEEYKREDSIQALVDHYAKILSIRIARRFYRNEDLLSLADRVMIYMQDHMTEELDVGQIADFAYVSKSYLSRIFKEHTGLSLMEYLRLLRMKAAEIKLIASDMGIEEIAYSIGYNSPKHFTNAFRDHFGMSPREYRKNKARDL